MQARKEVLVGMKAGQVTWLSAEVTNEERINMIQSGCDTVITMQNEPVPAFDENYEVKLVKGFNWIDVKDQYPPDGMEVFVHILGQVFQVTRDSKWSDGWKRRNCYGWEYVNFASFIHHWLPMNVKLPIDYYYNAEHPYVKTNFTLNKALRGEHE